MMMTPRRSRKKFRANRSRERTIGIRKLRRNATRLISSSSTKKATEKLRDLGFTSALVVPARGIFRGESALINLQDGDANNAVVAPMVAQHIALESERGREDGANYPTSLMGCIALVRQTFLDAAWYQSAQEAYRKAPATTERPEDNASLAALAEFAQRKQPSVFEAEDELDLLRVLRLADEFKLKPIIYGNGYEYRVRKSLGKTPIILPLDFPKVPEVERSESGARLSTRRTAALGSRAEQSRTARRGRNSDRLHHREAGKTGQGILVAHSTGR